ncbi:hypothetical protein Q7P36_007025 [Cladosporium allicinum]
MGAPAKNPSSTKPQSSATTSTTPPTIYKAAHAVLNTNELLCEIIGHLPLESIVATTGVCKTWRAALKASAAIQQALFLAPTNISRITTSKADFSERVEAIPGERCVVIGEVHPSLARICGPVSSNSVHLPRTNPFQVKGTTPREPFEHPAGLWQNMLMTQPPTSHVDICLYANRPMFTHLRGTRDCASYPLQCDEGIRMGQLYDFIEYKAMMFPEPVAVRVILPGFDPENDPSQREHKWYW